MNGLEDVCSLKWNTLVESVTFFIAFSFGLSEIVVTDEILLKTCEKSLGYKNVSHCSTLSLSPSLQATVQPRATELLALKSFIENLIPAIVCIFLGTWSDVIGRKQMIVIAVTGCLIYHTSLALLSYFNVDVYWYLVASTIMSMSGGFPAIVTASYCYAADITNLSAEIHRVLFVDLVLIEGKIIGCLVHPALVDYFGYSTTFATSALGCLLGLIFASVLLNETVPADDRDKVDDDAVDNRVISMMAKLLDWISGNPFTHILFGLFAVMLLDDNAHGTFTTLYLFAQRYHWNLRNFSIYTAARFVTMTFGLIFLSSEFVKSRIPLEDISITVIAILFSMVSAFTRAFATRSLHLFIAMAVGAFNWIPVYITRNYLIQSTTRRDFGKVFAALMVLERIALSFVAPLNVFLCTHFITTYPHPVWLMQVSLNILALLFYYGIVAFSLINLLSEDNE